MIGKTLGNYHVLEKIGAGGMGEVYRAHDTKLGRDVALKVLPDAFARDLDRLARFEREAHVLASLNHPNIAAIYSLEESGGVRFLVLELVPGKTLAERLARGSLPIQEALSICRQVAEALEGAHERGIIHRDLKPANIKVMPDGKVKVLDFGLAKALAGESLEADLSESPTISEVASRSGVILGTAAYMSPEQARGKPLDSRTDIWSFGCVLYEALASRQSFRGETVSDTLAAILTREPDWAALPAHTPARIRELLRRCLQKDSFLRLRHIGDARLEIADVLARPAEAHKGAAEEALAARAARWQRAWMVPAALLIGLAFGASSLVWLRPHRTYWRLPQAAPKQVLRQTGQVTQATLAPDGEQFVYVLNNDLYLQVLAGGDPRRLTNDGLPKFVPRFSPDGKRVLYARRPANGSGSDLYVLDLPAGLPRLLVKDALKGVWSPDGSKLAFVRGSTKQALVVDAEGKELASLGSAEGFDWALGLSWAPVGDRLAVVDKRRVYIVSADGRSRREIPEVRAADALFTPDGEFLLVQMGGGGYWTTGQVRVTGGEPIPFSVMPFEASGVTMDRQGTKLLVVYGKEEFNLCVTEPAPEAIPDRFHQITFGGLATLPALSPDEKTLAFTDWRNLWLVNVDGTGLRRLTDKPAIPVFPEWAPDGKTIVFGSAGDEQIWTIRLDEGIAHPFSTVEGKKHLAAITADGGHIVFSLHRDGRSDLWLAPVAGGEAVALTGDGISAWPRPAPAGTAVAYVRKAGADKYEIRVIDTASKQSWVVVPAEVLGEFGEFYRHAPRWSRDGRYLFLSTSSGVLRVPAGGGKPEKFSFVLPRSFFWEDITEGFDIFSNSRKMVFMNVRSNIQPWLYSNLR